MLRPALPRIGQSFKLLRRSLHSVPFLKHDPNVGIPGLLSPSGYSLAWTQYQGQLVQRVNQLTTGTRLENHPVKEIALLAARDPGQAATFNYASMAHNNHFFFESLASQETAIPNLLKQDLLSSFSSIETLQKEMIGTANAMFGPGFVWLVKQRDASKRGYALLTTYLAGSPYPGAHYRRQAVDMNTEAEKAAGSTVAASTRALLRNDPVNTVGAHGVASKKPSAPGGVEAIPILCINTWQHVYLPDYGIVTFEGKEGKREYAENWWKAIDWNVVDARTGRSATPHSYMT